ncbi:MBL fold metallo-hydrolase [bacterium]|nr:MBL fold metallo-hydrolase [bacterium]
MDLTVLGSSSSGNGYVLQNETEALVIECGVSLKEVKKAVDFNITKIVGALVTHEHGDHAGHFKEFLNARINVWMSEGTIGRLIDKNYIGQLPRYLKQMHMVELGSFTIMPFNVKHDAAEPLGFMINHPEMGNILFVTDSYYIPFTFSNLSNILIECNYRMDLLENNIKAGRIPAALRDRTLQSHMSFDTCREALLANDLRGVNNIVLVHLSDSNSNEEEFKRDIHLATGKTVHVAKKGLKIKINRHPF